MKENVPSKPYIPISCDLYDEFEALATLKKRVQVHYLKNDTSTRAEGVIKDFKVRDKVEYMILDPGLEIRLDHLISVDHLIMSDWASCDPGKEIS